VGKKKKKERERIKDRLGFIYLLVESSALSATHIYCGIIVNQLSLYQNERERTTENFSLSPLIRLLNFISPASRLTSIPNVF